MDSLFAPRFVWSSIEQNFYFVHCIVPRRMGKNCHPVGGFKRKLSLGQPSDDRLFRRLFVTFLSKKRPYFWSIICSPYPVSSQEPEINRISCEWGEKIQLTSFWIALRHALRATKRIAKTLLRMEIRISRPLQWQTFSFTIIKKSNNYLARLAFR